MTETKDTIFHATFELNKQLSTAAIVNALLENFGNCKVERFTDPSTGKETTIFTAQ